jgi:3-phosphoshikimate 1-carboxyvinyltransferase
MRFENQRALLDGEDVTAALRQEEVGSLASRIAALPAVRRALVDLQCSFRKLPGLVADGRDMGTVIFPGAALKVFLTASADTRAERRYKQLLAQGVPANITALRADLRSRDDRDQNRSVAPLKPAAQAHLLDNSDLSIEDSVGRVLNWWQVERPIGVS